jgi:hypothetical protein
MGARAGLFDLSPAGMGGVVRIERMGAALVG